MCAHTPRTQLNKTGQELELFLATSTSYILPIHHPLSHLFVLALLYQSVSNKEKRNRNENRDLILELGHIGRGGSEKQNVGH